SPYTFHYTTVSGDNSLSNLGGNIASAMRADTTLLAANVAVPFNGASFFASCCFEYNPNIGGLGSSRLTITGSDAASDAIYNFGTMAPFSAINNPSNFSCLPDGAYLYFTYSALLGGWHCRITGQPGNSFSGINAGPPLEFYADLCNRAGVGCYIQIGVMWSADRISKTIDFFARNLNKELMVAYSNE